MLVLFLLIVASIAAPLAVFIVYEFVAGLIEQHRTPNPETPVVDVFKNSEEYVNYTSKHRERRR